MPFVAKDSQTGERVVIAEVADPRTLVSGRYVCPWPDCGGKLYVKAVESEHVRPHFAHAVECSTRCDHEHESAEHLAGKAYLYDQWVQRIGRMRDDDPQGEGGPYLARVEYEVMVQTAATWRVADVMVTWPSGQRLALECQLAAIQVEGHGGLRERTADYAALGIDVRWYLGEGCASDTPANRDWLLRVFGDVLKLRFVRDASNGSAGAPFGR